MDRAPVIIFPDIGTLYCMLMLCLTFYLNFFRLLKDPRQIFEFFLGTSGTESLIGKSSCRLCEAVIVSIKFVLLGSDLQKTASHDPFGIRPYNLLGRVNIKRVVYHPNFDPSG